MKVRSKETGGHIEGLSETDAKELVDGGTYEAVKEEAKPKTKKPVEPMRLPTPTPTPKPKATPKKPKGRGK